MVCEGFDLCKHLHIDFRVGFIEAGAPKLNSFCSGVVNFSVLVIDISMQNVQLHFFGHMVDFWWKTYKERNQKIWLFWSRCHASAKIWLKPELEAVFLKQILKKVNNFKKTWISFDVFSQISSKIHTPTNSNWNNQTISNDKRRVVLLFFTFASKQIWKLLKIHLKTSNGFIDFSQWWKLHQILVCDLHYKNLSKCITIGSNEIQH